MYSMYSMYCTASSIKKYAQEIQHIRMYLAPGSFYLVLSTQYLVTSMHPNASVCIHMYSCASVTHPYAPIRLHALKLPIRTQYQTHMLAEKNESGMCVNHKV